MNTREEFLENEVRTLNHHIQSMIDTMKVMSMNKQDMSNEIERLKSEVETAVKAEREACASIEVHLTTPDRDYTTMSPLDAYEAALMDAAVAFREAIRARGQE
jgi:hypothetical protein